MKYFFKGILRELILIILVGTMILFQPLLRYMSDLLSQTGQMPGILLFYTSHSQGCFDIFAPALASIPFSAKFIVEYNGKNIYFILTRQSKWKYCVHHIIIRLINGGLGVALPNVILLIFCAVFGTSYTPNDVPRGYSTLFQDSALEPFQFMLNGYMVAVIVVILSFVMGLIWSSVGILFSALLPNKYAAVAFPMIVYYFISLILYGIGANQYSPMAMIIPNAEGIESLGFVFLLQFIVLTICVVSSYILMMKRVKDV